MSKKKITETDWVTRSSSTQRTTDVIEQRSNSSGTNNRNLFAFDMQQIIQMFAEMMAYTDRLTEKNFAKLKAYEDHLVEKQLTKMRKHFCERKADADRREEEQSTEMTAKTNQWIAESREMRAELRAANEITQSTFDFLFVIEDTDERSAQIDGLQLIYTLFPPSNLNSVLHNLSLCLSSIIAWSDSVS
ncbi:hypothetical protein HELRODRAFT_161675 [Helobdella robusta]|uniref:DUF4200 domain-containing protein n=1 Tax=Helobdella robusta TaxID=6412 RepID=T1ERS2_HELRO|nr:hypothetical protein HELRODRAFT_161675 [Helobdella robusta]ESO02408.1 hypothetical protein HELRODRAFT_161675 [Helobdella robusta]